MKTVINYLPERLKMKCVGIGNEIQKGLKLSVIVLHIELVVVCATLGAEFVLF